MPTIQELYRNLENHELELKGYKRNDDDKKKGSLVLKASNSFDNDKDELAKFGIEDDEDDMALLSEKLQRILR